MPMSCVFGLAIDMKHINRSIRLDQIRSCYIREIRPQLAKAIDSKTLRIVDSLVADQGLHGYRISKAVGSETLSHVLWTKCRRTDEVYAFVKRCNAFDTEWTSGGWHDCPVEREEHMQSQYQEIKRAGGVEPWLKQRRRDELMWAIRVEFGN